MKTKQHNKSPAGIGLRRPDVEQRMSRLRAAIGALIALLAVSASASSLEEQIRTVERIRGLQFAAPVRVVTIDRAELPLRLREQFTKTLPYSPAEWALMLRALHLADQDGDKLIASLLDLYQAQVLAFYDPLSHTYFALRELPDSVRDIDPTGMVQETVALHELTHALQDQRFHVGDADLALRNDADASFALHAVAEGEATLVMLAAMAEKSGSSLDELTKSDQLMTSIAAAATRAGAISDTAPPYFVEMMKFPYIDGLRFVVEAYRRGGWKAVDALWSDPPRSTREVLHPEEYFGARFHAEPFVAKPPVPVPFLMSVEHLGEFHWAYLVGAANARGWSGDRVTIAQNADCQPTVLVETKWDTPAAARRFRDAYARFLDEHDEKATVMVEGRSVNVGYGADRDLIRRFFKR